MVSHGIGLPQIGISVLGTLLFLLLFLLYTADLSEVASKLAHLTSTLMAHSSAQSSAQNSVRGSSPLGFSGGWSTASISCRLDEVESAAPKSV